MLAPPLLAFALVYLASLVALFLSSFWTVDPFTSEIRHAWNIDCVTFVGFHVTMVLAASLLVCGGLIGAIGIRNQSA